MTRTVIHNANVAALAEDRRISAPIKDDGSVDGKPQARIPV